MKRIAKFEKVSLDRFTEDCGPGTDAVYGEIRLPRRATGGSAGYDFFSTLDFTLEPGQEISIPTGIRAKIDEGWVLSIYPRSGLGFKYRVRLNNTVGIIDSDYYGSSNEGHIFIKISNCGDKRLSIKKGDAFAQGIFTEYGITVDDEADGVRDGGFGSTNTVASYT